MKKRFTVLLLVLALVLPIAACGSKQSSSGSSAPVETATEAPETTTEAPETTTEAPETTTEAPETTAEAPETTTEAPETTTEAPETTTEAPETSAEKPFAVGTVSGQTYTNEFLGITAEFPEGWTFYSEEELAQMNGIVADQMNNETAAEALKNGDLFYDLYVSSPESLNSVNIVFEDLGPIYGVTISEERYVELSLQNVADEVESQGFNDVVVEQETIMFAGAPHESIILSSTYPIDEDNSVEFYERIIAYKQGNYVAGITIGALFADNTDEIVALFNGL